MNRVNPLKVSSREGNGIVEAPLSSVLSRTADRRHSDADEIDPFVPPRHTSTDSTSMCRGSTRPSLSRSRYASSNTGSNANTLVGACGAPPTPSSSASGELWNRFTSMPTPTHHNTNHASRTIIVQQTPHSGTVPSAFDSTEVSGSGEYYRDDCRSSRGH